eukprot:m.60102 g.60102  ORF g.60102 m.60102 type:complete len:136 (+) comp34916_c0_seq5:2611-3018(+)
MVGGGKDAPLPTGGTRVGTKPYMAREVFDGVITVKIDVYAFGMVLHELATGLPPYSSKKKLDLKSYIDNIEMQGIDLQKMLDPKAKWPKAIPLYDGKFNSAGLQLLGVAKKATERDYKSRPGIEEILPLLCHLSS